MGDPGASIPTPQPMFYRPQFAAHGRAKYATSVTFVSGVALSSGNLEPLHLSKRLVAVKNTRSVTKRDLLWNDLLPKIEVDPETLHRQSRRPHPRLRTRERAPHGPALLPILGSIMHLSEATAQATPKVLNLPAQGCEERATLGIFVGRYPTLKGLNHPVGVLTGTAEVHTSF